MPVMASLAQGLSVLDRKAHLGADSGGNDVVSRQIVLASTADATVLVAFQDGLSPLLVPFTSPPALGGSLAERHTLEEVAMLLRPSAQGLRAPGMLAAMLDAMVTMVTHRADPTGHNQSHPASEDAERRAVDSQRVHRPRRWTRGPSSRRSRCQPYGSSRSGLPFGPSGHRFCNGFRS